MSHKAKDAQIFIFSRFANRSFRKLCKSIKIPNIMISILPTTILA